MIIIPGSRQCLLDVLLQEAIIPILHKEAGLSYCKEVLLGTSSQRTSPQTMHDDTEPVNVTFDLATRDASCQKTPLFFNANFI